MIDLTQNSILAALDQFRKFFAAADVDGIVAAFTDDCKGRFGLLPTFNGKGELAAMLEKRLSSMQDYRLEKTLELIAAPQFVSSWTGTWVDPDTGQQMENFGVEIITLRNGLICEWTAAASAGVRK
ncbi:nuclear transport factor 2 family protein [uncultured Nitratireductor sp.]|uniref:nuclear transport factor 2 family protein n=1 Tax=uncultured Nitratireductor sp. TaxID=520953 RepID=UPI0026384E19|nr:nuclear transport factor 2 family protein [uncultured Nitratireductor sp.]